MKNAIKITILGILLCGFVNASPIVYTSTFPSGYPTLEQVDLTTGNAVLLATIDYSGIVNDIAQSPINGELYGLSGNNLFTITTGGKVAPIVNNLNGSSETLAFDGSGQLYIGTQSALYKYNLVNATAQFIGNYGGAEYLNNGGQNMRFSGNTLYLANTGGNGNTQLYTVNLDNGSATYVGNIVGQPSLVLGNYNNHLYGSSVPAINSAGGNPDVIDFGSVVTVSGGNVKYTVIGDNFPENVNFTAANSTGDVAVVPEPSQWALFGIGGFVVYFAGRSKKKKV